MSQAHLGSFSGTVTPGVNMLDVFKQNERADNPNSILNFGKMSLKIQNGHVGLLPFFLASLRLFRWRFSW